MSLIKVLRELVPQRLKNLYRYGSREWRLSRQISDYLPETVCVDVGASYFPHGKWLIFLNARNAHWLAVEPNEKNIGYVKSWHWPSRVSVCTNGLSKDGGPKVLYVTHVDSGSSLFPPEIPLSLQHRITKLDYFFPLSEKNINTLTLIQLLNRLPDNSPVIIKLDTQGTELSILQGAQPLFDAKRIVGIEMESSLLAQPVMKGAGKFWQACEFLESQGFELLHITPISGASFLGRGRTLGVNRFLNECDAVFTLRSDVVEHLPVDYRISLLAFYLSYQFYEEAWSLLERGKDVSQKLAKLGCDVYKLQSMLVSMS